MSKEVKAVKKILGIYGLKASVKQGRGTGWHFVSIEPAKNKKKFTKKEKAILKVITRHTPSDNLVIMTKQEIRKRFM